jgi:hypothetical protein
MAIVAPAAVVLAQETSDELWLHDAPAVEGVGRKVTPQHIAERAAEP